MCRERQRIVSPLWTLAREGDGLVGYNGILKPIFFSLQRRTPLASSKGSRIDCLFLPRGKCKVGLGPPPLMSCAPLLEPLRSFRYRYRGLW